MCVCAALRCAVHCAYVTYDGNLHECKFSLYHIISAGCELAAANLSGCMFCIYIGILLVKLNQSINQRLQGSIELRLIQICAAFVWTKQDESKR